MIDRHITKRRILEQLDEGLARSLPFRAPVLLHGDDDDFLTTMHRDVLRPLGLRFPNDLAEASFRVLQCPTALPRARANSGHPDQYTPPTYSPRSCSIARATSSGTVPSVAS